MTETAGHYTRLAPTFTRHWSYNEPYVDWMTACLLEHLRPEPGHTLVDLGCGTGIYAQRLANHAHAVLCVEPVQAMLNQLPPNPRLPRLVATAEQFANAHPASERYDAILLKEVIHHLHDRPSVIRGLARRLRPQGRLLVVMLPNAIQHPLFQAAHDRYTRSTLTPEHVANWMRQARLDTMLTTSQYHVRIPTERFLDMVGDRYMSLLTHFTDDELTAGINEIRTRHPDPFIEFNDEYVFIAGVTRPDL